MIKLPDYSQCVELKHLLLNMGIHEIEGKQLMVELPDLDQEVTEEKNKLEKCINDLNFIKEKVDFYDKLEKTGIELRELSDTELNKSINQLKDDELLSIKGFKCCAYIKSYREVYDVKEKRPKFHLFNCKTIGKQIAEERSDRYVLTTRVDGLFPVIVQHTVRVNEFDSHEEIDEKEEALELCGNCRSIAKNQGSYSSFLDENNKFSLKLFFKDNRSKLPPFKPEELEAAKRRYAENHKQVAKRYKEACNYRCQICGLDLTNNSRWLDLHHMNGDGTDNRRVNLRVLCLCCHAEQYNHSHMKSDNRWKEGASIVQALRKEQGIYSIR